MMVNWEFMDNMTPESATQLVDDLRAGAEVHSTRGPRICTWREAERVLAGFPDDLADEGPVRRARLAGRPRASPASSGWTAPQAEAARPAAGGTADDEAARPSRPTPRAPRPRPRPTSRADAEHPKAGTTPVTDMLTPVLTDNWDAERSWTLAAYESRGGYGALTKALGDGARPPSSRRSRTPACAAAAAPASRPA